ncbi:hypothetical protein [Cellulosimicrobium arenosum]|uniref:Uncharacterized protein n=1 Tax=Cellulosimicrobium arenosum TaxID=2708133 RepID=A0A927J047_9MICO|nr:hypothetical protein [Cellulosimicrobium arenosum]MBD8079315.1 hypothetical protein [Cellulosimicrobium arenosum]
MSTYDRLEVDARDPLAGYVADCAASLRRVIGHFDVETALPDLELLAADQPGLDLSDLARVAGRTGTTFSTDLVAALVTAHLVSWDDGGAPALCLASLYDHAGPPEGDAASRALLDRWIQACTYVALVARRTGTAEARAVAALRNLAAVLTETDRDTAVACALDAIMLASLAPGGAATLDAAQCLSDVARGHDEDLVRLALAYRADGMSRLPAHERDDLALWDAVESACRYRPQALTLHDAAAQSLRAAIERVPAVRDLRATFALGFDHTPGRAATFAPLRPFTDPVWTFDATTLQRTLDAFRGISTSFDERRLRLVPPPESTVATADIDEWSIDHRAFRHAVPFSTGFRREADRKELLLVLGHELVHIDSTFGWLGTSLAALRSAATADEILHHLRQVDHDAPDTDRMGRLCELEPEAALLPVVERQLELVRKAQVLRSVWTPWLEGLAMFGELAADPTTDDERSTGFGGALVHLVDRHRDPDHDPPLEQWYASCRAEAERGYADALHELARPRLRGYLGAPVGRYLAGYLAVRGVTSAWREHSPMDGVETYQALLGATRSTTQHAVPDLSLPPEEFEGRAVALMREWVAGLASLDRGSVQLLDPYRGRTPRDVLTGEPVRPPSSVDAATLARDAGVPRADRRPELADLAPGPREELARLLDAVAGGLGTHDVHLLGELTYARARRMHLVPIGRFDALFWLWADAGGSRAHLFLQLRVTHAAEDAEGLAGTGGGGDAEDGRDADSGGYSLYGVPLTLDERSRLVAQMEADRRVRMEVHRLVDRASSREDGVTSGQVLALRYGDFVKVLSGGLHTGVDPAPSLVEDVEARLRPEPLTRLDLHVNDAHALAARALTWLDTLDTLDAGDDPHPALATWRDRVGSLARQVAEPGGAQQVDQAGLTLLAALGWSTTQVADVSRDGLAALADDELSSLAPVLDALLASGRDGALADLQHVDPGLARSIFTHGPRGYDVRPFPQGAP